MLKASYSWADELVRYGIAVNACLGAVGISGNAPEGEQLRAKVGRDHLPEAEPDRSPGFHEPSEAAKFMLSLASDDAADARGCYFGIDGPRLTVWDRRRSSVPCRTTTGGLRRE